MNHTYNKTPSQKLNMKMSFKIVKILCKNPILLLTLLIMQTLQPRGQVGGAVTKGRVEIVRTWTKYCIYQSFYCHNLNLMIMTLQSIPPKTTQTQ